MVGMISIVIWNEVIYMKLEEAKKQIPSITKNDLNKSLNALHLNLFSKGFTIPKDFFGLKIL